MTHGTVETEELDSSDAWDSRDRGARQHAVTHGTVETEELDSSDAWDSRDRGARQQ